jgi:hypothetical protein
MSEIYYHPTTLEFVIVNCAICGVPFTLEKDYERRRREDHSSFYCPSGHSNFFPAKSDVEQLRHELNIANSNSAALREQLEIRKEDVRKMERKLIARKGQVTKYKNQAQKGKCLYCEHQFPDLEKHMKDKHPHYNKHINT